MLVDIVTFMSNTELAGHGPPVVGVVHRRRIPLTQAADARRVSGDVAVFTGTARPVPATDWLWPWERDRPESYAHRVALAAG